MIIRSFGSILEFTRQLELYLQHYRHHSPQGRSNNRSKVKRKKGGRRFAVVEDLDTYEGGTTNSASFRKQREERNRLHEVRISLLRGEEISQGDSDALERIHRQNLRPISDDDTSPPVKNPIKSAYEKLISSKKRNASVDGAVAGQDLGSLNSNTPQHTLNILSSSSDTKIDRNDHTGQHQVHGQTGHDVTGNLVYDKNVIIEDDDYDMLTSYMDPNARKERNELYEKPESTALSVPLSALLSMFHK